MIIDLILDRKDGVFYGDQYDAREFYTGCMRYGEIGWGIARAMDGGTEEDVKDALCQYIEKNDYNPLICDYIKAINWLGETEPAAELEAARAFNEACRNRELEANLDSTIAAANIQSQQSCGRENIDSDFVKE